MRTLILMIALCISLVGCKSAKNITTDTRQKEQKNVENNISQLEVSTIDQVVDKAVQKFFNEKLNADITTTIYDTEKPVNPDTGKPPIKEETNISLSKETNETTGKTEKTETSEKSALQLEDKSKDKSKVDSYENTKVEKGFTFWEVLGLSVIASLFIGLVIFLIYKFK